MPALPVRRTLVTGMRSFPFRDWKRTEGLPAVPGYNPVWDWQPVMTETMRAGGVRTVYVTDNPTFEGPRFPDVRRPSGSAPAGDSDRAPTRRHRGRNRRAQARHEGHRAHVQGRHRGAARAERPRAVFVAIDPFDPVDAEEAPPILRQARRGGGARASARWTAGSWRRAADGADDSLREAYRDHVEAVDGWVGQADGLAAREPARVHARRHRHGARRARLHRPRRAHLLPRPPTRSPT